jgi:hypothetical protein
MPLSAYLRERLAYRPPEGVLLPALADDTSPTLRLLDHIGQAMRWYLPTSADTGDPLVMSFHRIGLSAAHGFDYGSLHEDTTRGLARAAVTAETHHRRALVRRRRDHQRLALQHCKRARRV